MPQDKLSQKDLTDLAALRDKLPQGDERVGRINQLLDANGFTGKYGDFSQRMAAALAPGIPRPATPAGLVPTATERFAQQAGDFSNTMSQAVLGSLKGAGHTAFTVGKNTAAMVPGAGGLQAIPTPQAVTPSNGLQRVGYGVEQAGEFFVPGAGEEAAVSKIPYLSKFPRLAKYAYSGATQGGVNVAHGGDFGPAAALGAAVPAVADAAAGSMRSLLGMGLNRLMYPNNKDIGLFKNPARGVFDEGIFARNLTSLGEQAQAAKQATWMKLQNMLGSSRAILPTQESIWTLDKLADQAARDSNLSRAQSLDEMRNVLQTDSARIVNPANHMTGTPGSIEYPTWDRGGMTGGYVTDDPLSLELRNQALADLGRPTFSTRPYDNATAQVQKQIWGQNRQMITDAVPGADSLLQHYADLRGAANAATQRASFEAGGRGVLSPVMQRIIGAGIGSTIGGSTGYAATHDPRAGFYGALIGGVAPSLINNTPFYTGAAKGVELLNPFLQTAKNAYLANSTMPPSSY